MVSKQIILLFLFSLFSIGVMCTPCYICILFSLFPSFYIARRLRVCCILYYNSKVILTNKKYLTYHLKLELIVCVLTLVIVLIFGFIVDGKANPILVQVNSQMFIITFLMWTGIFYLKKLTGSEKSYLSSVNNLTLGFGAAIWYYKNYLDRILPENFLMRVKQYEKEEEVQIPRKLYILCPKSCKVKQYIDNTDYIDSSKDLPPYEMDHGGIPGRKYSVSVYCIKYNGEFFRCALEYAQPLKALLGLLENGRINLSELDIERESFIKNLKQMLKDRKNSFEVCELVEYDDDTDEIYEVLSGLPSVQAFKQKIGE